MNNQKEKQPILMLIDGNALVYRSFYGMPPLTTKNGILVNAVYGFTASVFSAIEAFNPEYICVAFDVSKKTWRNKEYSEYKANRQKAPQELYDQLPLVKEVVNALNIPQFGIKDYEADDVIGTVATKVARRKIKNKKLKTVIVTGDMDTLQLVDENTNVYSISRGIKRAEVFNAEKVREKYGFDPKHLVDYKALRGDPSDNIPGVAGVGDKTAVNLIKAFGTVEKLYNYLEKKSQITNSPSRSWRAEADKSQINSNFQISERVKKLLLDHKKEAFLSKKLGTIIKDMPIDFDLSFCKVSDYDKDKAEKLFKKLEFKSLLKRFPRSKPNHKQESLF